MVSVLRLVVAAIAVLFTAGVPSYVAAAVEADCCAEPCEDAPAGRGEPGHDDGAVGAQEHGEEAPGDRCPGEHDGRCPPLCDGCASAPHAVAPAPPAATAAPSTQPARGDFPALVDPMSDPLRDGVFHPPRAAA